MKMGNGKWEMGIREMGREMGISPLFF